MQEKNSTYLFLVKGEYRQCIPYSKVKQYVVVISGPIYDTLLFIIIALNFECHHIVHLSSWYRNF